MGQNIHKVTLSKNEVSFVEADFKGVVNMLANNRVERIVKPDNVDMGNILFAGAIDRLVAHILAEFLEHDSGTAWCLVRGQDEADSRQRLAEAL